MQRQMRGDERRRRIQRIKELLEDLGGKGEMQSCLKVLRQGTYPHNSAVAIPKVDVAQLHCGSGFRWNIGHRFPIPAPSARRRRRRLKREIIAVKLLTHTNALVKAYSREFAIGASSWTKSSMSLSLSPSQTTTELLNRRNSSTRGHRSL